MTNVLVTRSDVEDLLFDEADRLDNWDLDGWLSLWAPGEISYQIGPTGEWGVEQLSPNEVLFLVSDDRFRLEQRVVRMKKKSAHAENPRSRTRHMVGNVRIRGQEGPRVDITFNENVVRTQAGITAMYPAKVFATLQQTADGLRIVSKKVALDLDHLATPGTLTIFL